MPNIRISADGWDPWFDHELTNVDPSDSERIIKISDQELAYLDKLAEYVEEYHRTLAKLANRKSIYDY